MKRVVLTLYVLLFLVAMIACASRQSTPSIPAGQAPATGKEPAKEAVRASWEKKWESTLKVAQQEGRVVIYVSSMAPSLKEATPLVKKKYGLNLEIITGRGSELRGKLLQERNNGLFLPDVFISGLNTIYGTVKSAGAIDPIEPALMLPEVLDTKLWFEGKLPFADEERRIFSLINGPKPMLGYNTEMVKPAELQSIFDLLNPRWKGKILINDPTVTGSSFASFSTFIYYKVVDADFFRQIVSQQNLMLRDMRLVVDWVAKGRYPVALWAHEAYMAEYTKAGAPIAWVNIKEGAEISSMGGNLVLVNKAPHPSAAKIFINWFLSKEGQTIMQNIEGAQSSREDIPTGSLDPLRARQPGGKYYRATNEKEQWVLNEQEKYIELAKQIFNPLLEK